MARPWRVCGMAESVGRRIKHLSSVLTPQHGRYTLSGLRLMSTSNGKTVSIGGISKDIKLPKNPELVPIKYLPKQVPQSILKHLRWIMQKDLLKQDVFLIGPPGPLRRSLAMMYLEMTKREAEYVSLSRDTTETDLKQRREIRAGNAFHIDQCAVRAATEGRILILEGIEKAERNVLPVLNNLLENREMQLDDGRFLMAADRYDKLLQEHTLEELNAWKLVRVSDDFRVIALGLPVPRYRGNPLDPPLRSRFQARDINPLPFKDQVEVLNAVSAGVPPDRLSQILSCASTLRSSEANSIGLPDFPVDNLPSIIKILSEVPSSSSQRLIQRLYPHDVMLGKEGRTAVEDALKSFELLESGSTSSGDLVTEVRRHSEGATVQIHCNNSLHSIQVKSGTLEEFTADHHFVNTRYHDNLLADMMTSHMVKDFCVIGPRGCGKSALVQQFADLLGYHIEPIMLYQDMTSRDLVQQRMTLPSGDTAWRRSPLVTAAIEGSLAVLDGVHRVNAGTFAVLHRLIHDRELALFDGTRLLNHDRYESVKAEHNLSDQEMESRAIFPIHPSFRIVALSEPPVVGSSTQQWLNSEMLTMFLYHHMRSMSQKEEMEVLKKLVPNMADMKSVMQLTHKLRQAHDSNLKSVAQSLSSRQLLRIAKRLAQYPGENLYDIVQKACLARFLPRLARNALEDELEQQEITKPPVPQSVEAIDRAVTCEIKGDTLRIGNTEVSVYNPENKMKVPDVLFYENPQHLAIMEDMLKDFMLGEHLLLVGNQGVGKNKIIDRFLYLLNRPREYLQLHRDTTVQTLTLQPTVLDGVIVYEDSPLVRAVKHGHILVVDEADKAPTNVTCILKTLVESGEMHLADGRRIVSASSGIKPSPSVIVSHPDFRMFVLANRPGFPFLGNDFFGAMGDIFSCHAVDNPDTESEMSMLRQYGPSVPEGILRKLVLAFGELREMADQGLISYPYSTREVVNMVKHLEKFPEEGLANVVKNVFDFDSYNKELTETVVETLHKHGIPVGANPANVSLAKEFPLPELKHMGELQIHGLGERNKSRLLSLPVEQRHLNIKGPVKFHVQSFPLERTEARSVVFTEQEAFWTLPLHENSVIIDVAVTKGSQRQPSAGSGDIIHIATASPISVYTMDPHRKNLTCVDLYDIFPTSRGSFYRPRIHLAPLGFPLDANVMVHEEVSNITLSLNTETGDITRLDTATLLEAAAEKITRNFKQAQGSHRMCSDFSHEADGLLLFYKEDGQAIDVVTMLDGRCHSISLPLKIRSLHMLAREKWLIVDSVENKKHLLSHPVSRPMDYVLLPIEEDAAVAEILSDFEFGSSKQLDDAVMSAALNQQISSPNRVMVTTDTLANIGVGMPDLSSVDVYSAVRPPQHDETTEYIKNTMNHMLGGSKSKSWSRPPLVYLPQSGQVVRAVATGVAPKEVFPEGVKPHNLSGYLEVSDIVNHKLRYIPVPGVVGTSAYTQWFHMSKDTPLLMAGMSNDGLVTVDSGGCVRLWETALINLSESVRQWRQLIGDGGQRNLQITFDKESGKQATGPKHGKVDPTGAPHTGGNTWAGGTGGSNTAGLGGIGGPYRLDAGHDVTQVPDWEKEAVPPEVTKAAREMAQKAFKERLKEIEMSEYDADLYERFSGSVRRQVQALRVILDSLQAKGKERQWLNHQTHGDLDEAKLIEGITGEKGIYKRRGEKEPELGSPQQKPKLIKILCDVSGSMYRFNGYDGRLEREMESMLMVMEALENYEHKIKYEIIGHSGEGYNFDIVKGDKPPKNNKDRLNVLKTLHAHSQFCISGDNTLEAAQNAIKTITDEEADEHFVIVLSDANLDRYGIRPKHFADVLTSNEEVNAYTIFIGSLGDQANRLVKQMPSGRAFMCMDTKNLPQIMQQIFTSTMLSTR